MYMLWNKTHLVSLVGYLALSLFSICQGVSAQDMTPEIRARIESIVRRASAPLVLSDPSSSVRISAQQIVFPANDIEEMKGYGSKAVPVLTTFLLGKDARAERAAIRLLGTLGGAGTIDPLLQVLDRSPRPGSREEALRSLDAAPCSRVVAETVLRLAQSDANAVVRDLAKKKASSCTM
jgi:hypothetical protein